MRPLYLVFSHTNPEQLVRLARTLRNLSTAGAIAIHHDPGGAPLKLDDFDGIENLHFVPHAVRGEWGDFSQVEQFLHAMDWCMSNLDFDWLVTLTGQTYPLGRLEAFEQALGASPFDAFLHHFDALNTSQWPPGTAEMRCFYRYFKLPKFRYHHKLPKSLRTCLRRAREWFNSHQSLVRIVPLPKSVPTRLGFRRLSVPFGDDFRLYGGSTAMNVNRRSIEYLLAFVRQNRWYLRFFRRCALPDEEFFVTILANNRTLQISDENLRFIKWPSEHAASGAVITSADLDEALNSRAPFGLKFDLNVDRQVIDRLDQLMGLAAGGDKAVTA